MAVLEAIQQHLLVIAAQGHDRGREITSQQALDDRGRGRAPVDVVADQDGHGLGDRLGREVARNLGGELAEQVGMPVHVPDCVESQVRP